LNKLFRDRFTLTLHKKHDKGLSKAMITASFF
jgi:hypothetical protein